MSEQPTDTGREGDLTDVDLYCLECGYNLRGLAGDPRRCPECGYLNPVGLLEVPALFISAQLRRMETAPIVCVIAAMAAGIVALILAFVIALAPPGRPPVAPVVSLAVFQGILFILWFAGVSRFKLYCLNQPGWGRALCWYHVYAISLVMVILVLLTLEVWIYAGVMDDFTNRFQRAGLIVAAAASFLAVAGFGGRWAERKVRELLDPLQREVAVTMARERLRRRLLRGGS